MKSVVRLSLVRNERKRDDAKKFRGRMFGEIRETTSRMGDRITGFAFVGWAEDGSIYTAIGSGKPFGRSIPEICRDALNQHLGADLIDTPPPPPKGGA